MKRAIAFGLALSLANCGSEAPTTIPDQEAFSTAVAHSVANEGEEVELPQGVVCESDLLVGRLSIRRTLADEQDYIAFVVQDSNGHVPEFGLVQCFDRVTDDGVVRVVRSADGY